MQRLNEPRYIILFSLLICAVCSIFVSISAVALSARQEVNATLDMQKNVLQAAGVMKAGQQMTVAEIDAAFETVQAVIIDTLTGEKAAGVDAATFDQKAAAKDPARSRKVERNPSLITRVPEQAKVYEVRDDAGVLEMVILPIEGYGLWGTLYGFVALDADMRTLRGLTYYKHKETPGLGGEVDNPRWKALWPGRLAFDDSGEVKITVIKGLAGPASEAPYKVDGLSGATITSRGVTNMLKFWLGENGFGPYIGKLRGGAA
jgi:Na+-transporting NADH:ubiquinone oxidoreductase subunit C